mgnify:FL=1
MKKIILSLLISIILISTSYASQTIKVKTIPESVVELTLIENSPSYFQVIKKVNKTVDKNGEAVIAIEDKLPSLIDINARIKQDSVVVITKKISSQKTGELISLFIYPEGYNYKEDSSQKKNDTSSNNANLTNISANSVSNVDIPIKNMDQENSVIPTNKENPSPITGDVIAGDSLKIKNSFKYILYIIVVGIILGLVVFFIYKKNQDRAPPFQHHGKVVLKDHSTPAIDVSEYKDKPVHHYDHDKYRSNNQEFLKLKSQRRMEDLKRRMQQDLEEFKRLNKGGI